MSELVAIGGIRPLMKTLLEGGLLHAIVSLSRAKPWRRLSLR
jgi:hypothetical protein